MRLGCMAVVERTNMCQSEEEKEEEENISSPLPNWLWDDDDPDSYSMPVNRLSYTDAETVRRVYQLARDLALLFHEAGLLYWTSGGTTLGIIRHGGLIPWDDDLDLCILQEDEGRLVELRARMDEKGFVLQPSQPYAWKVFHREDSEPVDNHHFSHRYPFCDIFMMQRLRGKLWSMTAAQLCANNCVTNRTSDMITGSGGSRSYKHRNSRWISFDPGSDEACGCLAEGGYVLCEKSGQNAWPNEIYSDRQIQHIKYRLFGDILLPCPGRPDIYLDRTYGKNWATVGSTHSVHHRTERLYQADRFLLTEEMMRPACGGTT